jgi:hypothetical protein
MRFVLLASAAVLVVSCGKKEAAAPAAESPTAAVAAEASAAPAPVEDLWPDLLPKPSVDYAGVYDFGAAGETVEVKIASSGDDQRMAFPPGMGPGGAAATWSQVVLNQDHGAKMFMWPEGEGAPKIATTMSKNDLGSMAQAFGVDPADAPSAKRTGTDEVAGEKCAVFELANAESPGSVCVTRDGVMLRVTSGEQTVMQAKSIARGAQDPALFAPPAGYEIVDMGECMRLSAEMMEAVRAGKTPDMAKMEKCAALGEKMGAMFGRP